MYKTYIMYASFVRFGKLSTAVCQSSVHALDHAAGGFFEQAGNDRVDQRGEAGGKKLCCEPSGKAHMLEIGFIDGLRVLGENPLQGAGHDGISCSG